MATNFITQGGVTQSGQNLGTGAVDALHLSEYGGEVEHTLAKKSFMREFANIKPIRGTSTLTNDLVGESELQAVGRGSQRPDPKSIEFTNIAVKVDTIVLARATMPLLDEFQNRLDVRMEMGVEHGKKIAKFFDTAFIVQAIKAAQKDNAGKPKGWVGGTADKTFLASNLGDSALLLEAIEDIITHMEEKDVDVEECVLMLRPAEYMTLVRNKDLVDRDHSEGNGNRANRYILSASGLPIVKTNLMPKAKTAVAGSEFLSNAANGNAYDILEADARCVALIMHPKTLLAGETIPLTSKVFYDDKELQWFVDSYLSFGVTVNRPDHTGGLFLTTDFA